MGSARRELNGADGAVCSPLEETAQAALRSDFSFSVKNFSLYSVPVLQSIALLLVATSLQPCMVRVVSFHPSSVSNSVFTSAMHWNPASHWSFRPLLPLETAQTAELQARTGPCIHE